MPTNRITQQKLRDYMSKNAPQCEGAFLGGKNYQKIFGKTIDNGLWV